MSAIDSTKKLFTTIWPDSKLARAFGDNEKLDKYLIGWESDLNIYSQSDFEKAERNVCDDIVNETRGRDLDMPSLLILLPYLAAARRDRIARETNPMQTQAKQKTPEQIAAERAHAEAVLANLKEQFK